eukprot:COSAG01_NODE_67740_length_266_cov_0.616766_1_plen_88_part_11
MTFTDGDVAISVVDECFELHCDGAETGNGKRTLKVDGGTDIFEGTFDHGIPVRGTRTMHDGTIRSGAVNESFELHCDGVKTGHGKVIF